MCLKISRTCLVALVLGIYLELSVRNGICDDSQLSYAKVSTNSKNIGVGPSTSSTTPKPSSYSPESEDSAKQGRRVSWKGWEEWAPPSTPYQLPHERQQQKHGHKSQNHYIPLSTSEQNKIRSRRNRTDTGNFLKPTTSKSTRNTGSSTSTTSNKSEKTGRKQQIEQDLIGMRNSAINLASSAIQQFATYWAPSSEPKSRLSSRAIYLDNLSDRQEGHNYGKPEREANRGVIDWLSRLIGVQGKTLGEFLREYQVHVLYDLAFTFFKWIFFLYAGLLIP